MNNFISSQIISNFLGSFFGCLETRKLNSFLHEKRSPPDDLIKKLFRVILHKLSIFSISLVKLFFEVQPHCTLSNAVSHSIS